MSCRERKLPGLQLKQSWQQSPCFFCHVSLIPEKETIHHGTQCQYELSIPLLNPLHTTLPRYLRTSRNPCKRRNSPIRSVCQEPLFAAVLVQHLMWPRVFAGCSPVSVLMANGTLHPPEFYWSTPCTNDPDQKRITGRARWICVGYAPRVSTH